MLTGRSDSGPANGKRRITSAGLSKDDLLAAARENERIAALLQGKQIVKAITVPDRLVNIVVR